MTESVDYEAMSGYWNAWVMQGATKNERRERLERVPEPLRAGVESHVRTVFAIRQRAAQKARDANNNHNHNHSTGGAS